MAHEINSSLTGISRSVVELSLSVVILPPTRFPYDGINFEYARDFRDPQPTYKASEAVALALCENMKSNGIKVGFRVIPIKVADNFWGNKLPPNAVVIRVGAKPNRFWLNKRVREWGLRKSRKTFPGARQMRDMGRTNGNLIRSLLQKTDTVTSPEK